LEELNRIHLERNFIQAHANWLPYLKYATYSAYPVLLFCPMLIFCVLIGVKMDFPDRFSWMAAFSPLSIFGIGLTTCLIQDLEQPQWTTRMEMLVDCTALLCFMADVSLRRIVH
jgi:hypothetical protein